MGENKKDVNLMSLQLRKWKEILNPTSVRVKFKVPGKTGSESHRFSL